MVSIKSLSLLALNALPLLVSAHPGEVLSTLSIKRQARSHENIAARGAEKLARCANKARSVEVKKRAEARRAAKVEALMRRVKAKRDAAAIDAYDYSHNYTGSVSQDDAFSVNTSCILEPQMTIGPYWVSGEYIRSDPKESQEGVDIELELEFIDINTCEPVSDLYIDIWNANSTGVYSGVGDENTLDETYLRAIQITDDDGVVTFDTLVPGHYQGRATHTHVMVHQNVTEYANSTYTGGTVRSISQLFYDSALRAAVEETSPYSTNTQEITANDEDSLLSEVTLGDYDPFIKYITLGSSLSDGIFAWHSIGIDITANYTSNEVAAAAYYETGGVSESGSSSFGGGSGGAPSGGNSTGGSFGGNGTAPSGSGMSAGIGSYTIVSGTATSASATASFKSTSTSATITATYTGAASDNKPSWFLGKGKASRSVDRPQGKPSGSALPTISGGAAPDRSGEAFPAPTNISGSLSGFLTLPSGAPSGHDEHSKTGEVTRSDDHSHGKPSATSRA